MIRLLNKEEMKMREMLEMFPENNVFITLKLYRYENITYIIIITIVRADSSYPPPQ